MAAVLASENGFTASCLEKTTAKEPESTPVPPGLTATALWVAEEQQQWNVGSWSHPVQEQER